MTSSSQLHEITAPAMDTPRNRGCLAAILRVFKWFGIIIVALIILGVGYQTIATEVDKGKYALRGQLYTVNGHQMHLNCTGEGSPTVILEAGATAESLWWYWVQSQLAQQTRVCAYDRAGLGWSEAASGPREPLIVVDELYALLQTAGVAGPYIVAGHSFGAVWARVFATQYPQDVIGIVLVDSTVIPAETDYPSWKSFNDVVQGVLWVMTRTGVLRVATSSMFYASGYPSEIAQELSTRQALNQTFDATYAETIAAMPAFIQAETPAKNLRDLPLIVLWAGNGPMNAGHMTQVRDETANYSSNSVTRIVNGSDHGSILGNEQYAQQVTDAILDVLAAAETGDKLQQ